MTFISYAQNCEDVMLWRALKHINCGFYIDVGAAWPDEHSVTKAFYLTGWRGINIEPNAQFNELLLQQRPEDKNLTLAVGDKPGRVVMKFIKDTGLSTASNQIAHMHVASGWQVQEEEVELKTLAQICQQYKSPAQEIHFLKVDVEGLEESVLRGNDWTLFRPWVVLVEATLPMSQVESYESWEPVLLNAGYQFVYADGLNRFYLASEHSSLRAAFKYPPNVFDGFMLNSQKEAEAKAQQLEVNAQLAEAKAQQAETQASQSHSHMQSLESSLRQALEVAQTAQQQMQDATERAEQLRAQAIVYLQQQDDTRNEWIVLRQQTDEALQQRDEAAQQLAAVQQQLHDLHQANHNHWQQLEQAKQEMDRVHQSNRHHWQLADARAHQLQGMENSRSWRLTYPLRWMFGQVRRLRVEGFKSRLKALAKKNLREGNQKLYMHPALRQQLIGWSYRLGIAPKLKQLLAKAHTQTLALPVRVSAPETVHESENVQVLSPRAQQMYVRLRQAIEMQNKRGTH